MTMAQSRRFTLSAVAAALCIVTKATTWLDGLRIIGKHATFTGPLMHLGSRRFVAGRHIHIVREYNICRAPTRMASRSA